MNWEAYGWTQHPLLYSIGFWADVTYSHDQQEQVKGFVAVWKKNIGAIGHIWFTRRKHPESHLYLFTERNSIRHEIRRDLSFTDGDALKIPADISDKLVYLATSFRETHPEYSLSLDWCMEEVLKKTEKMSGFHGTI